MGLLYDHLCNQAYQTGADPIGLKFIQNLPVYEISNVLELLPDWEDGRESQIPKRPPHEELWVEWDQYDKGTEGLWKKKIGVVVGKETVESFRVLSKKLDDEGRKKLEEIIQQHDEYYLVRMFERVDHNTIDSSKIPVGVISWVATLFTFSLRDNAEKARIFGLTMSPDQWKPVLGIKAVSMNFYDNYDPNMTPWPPFMAFSLLHCRNVTTETIPGEPNPARLVKRGWPPLKKEYKVLRLELPKDLRPKPVTQTEADEERKMRFHLCRGHFKNLQHERFKAKGWHWWPAHWRGSKDLGEIEKRYELVGKPG